MKEGSPVQTKTPPKTLKERFLLIGPGLVAAATGVGAGDLVAALVAGTKFGTVFVWTIIAGVIIKYFLNEGVGRFQLASGQTILQGWRSLGHWALIYFGIYIVIWGFIYGAAGSSSAALAATAIFPQIPLKGWAILHAIICLIFVWIGRYQFFEKVMSLLTGIMFITLNLTKQQLLGFDTLIFFCQNAMESNRYPSIYIDINALTGILKTNYIQNVEEKGEG